MRNARARSSDGFDFARLQMNAMTEHRLRREQTGVFVDIGVVARGHVKVVHFLDFFAIFGEVRLDVSAVLYGEFSGVAHELFRASHSEPRAEGVLEATLR